jgi:hypothetical protein
MAFLAALAAILPACSQAPATAPGEPIAEAAIPHIRAGLWDMSWNIAGGSWIPDYGPTHERRYCDAGGPVMHRGGGTCVNVRYERKAGGDLEMDMDCTLEESRFRLHQVVSGDLQTAFTNDEYSWDLPKPLLGGEVIHRHSQQRYLGNCPPEMTLKHDN